MSELMAKEGTYAWALLQLQNGKRVSKKTWANQKEYLLRRLGRADQQVKAGDYPAQAGVKVGTHLNYLPYLERHTPSGEVMPWLASSVDMDAQDWEVMIQSSDIQGHPEHTLILDVTPYFYSRDPDTEKRFVSSERLVIVENNLGHHSVSKVAWVTYFAAVKPNYFTIDFGDIVADASESLRNVTDKKLTITIDDVDYHLGHRTEKSVYNSPQYQGEDAEKIGNMLKQFDRTFRFQCQWHD
ncbi:Thoeris anti-defense Tad2 family protein [Xenorhabdus budapestensis]|uniref:Uncharacterized protein n=1 Tax=Xenorhabdus budapestensis TaxID=290110 RepID=A0A2D0IN49_XENBU|nr:MW1434 family type I TA system toxin [Xenorhabdus budapestensis]PHM23261.1 hypothetical protein Xbud_03625 [Xenorhabdus budapestensis]